MAGRKSLSWVELRVGILVIASFGILFTMIFLVSGNLPLFTDTYSITAYFQSANGMKRGAEVWLEGVPVGSVGAVRVSESADPLESVAIVMDINVEYQDLIRTDSTLTIGTIGLLGDGYVDIVRGYTGEIIMDGGVIRGSSGGGIRQIIEGTDDLVANMGVLSEQVAEITSRVAGGEGTLGKLLTDPAIYDNLDATTAEANQLVRDARTGTGTIGRLMSDDQFYENAVAVVARMDALVTGIENGEGTVGRLLNDEGLYNQIDQVIGDFAVFTGRLERGEGTLGRLSTDDSLYLEARDSLESVSAMVESVANSEGTAGKLINDPALYNNMNTTMSELLKLLYDFRQEPEKFLTINFKLF